MHMCTVLIVLINTYVHRPPGARGGVSNMKEDKRGREEELERGKKKPLVIKTVLQLHKYTFLENQS